jgi:hypothetical protein
MRRSTIIILALLASTALAVQEGKKSADKWFAVKLVDSTDHVSDETGKAFGDTTIQYAAEGATSWTAYTDDASTWKEVGNGCYWLAVGASEFSSEAKYIVRVSVSGCDDYEFVVEVRDRTLAENIDNVDAILEDTDDIGVAGAGLSGIPWNAAWDAEVQSEAADALTVYDPSTDTEMDAAFAALNDPTAAAIVTALKGSTGWTVGGTATYATIVKTVYAMLRGKFTVVGNTMTVYDDDDTTVIATFTKTATGRTPN